MRYKAFGLVLVLAIGALVAAKPQGAKDKAKLAKVFKVDVAKMTLTVKWADGKPQEFKITDEVEFIGPLGGKSRLRLKDDRLAIGKEVGLVIEGTDNLKEIHLPYREGEKDKSDKGKPKDKGGDKGK